MNKRTQKVVDCGENLKNEWTKSASGNGKLEKTFGNEEKSTKKGLNVTKNLKMEEKLQKNN